MRTLIVLIGILLNVAAALALPILLTLIGFYDASVLWTLPLWAIGLFALAIRYAGNWQSIYQHRGLSLELITSLLIPVVTTTLFVAFFYGLGWGLQVIFGG